MYYTYFEPFVGIHNPPDHNGQHWCTPHQAGPVHKTSVQITSSDCWQAENWDHEQSEACCQCSDNWRKLSQMPWTSTESISNRKSSNGDRNGEGNKGSNRSDGEYGTDCDSACKYEQSQTNTNHSIKPYSVDRCLSALVNLLPNTAEREAIIASISVCNSGCRNHAPLPHGESTDNRQSQDG